MKKIDLKLLKDNYKKNKMVELMKEMIYLKWKQQFKIK